MPRGEGRFPKSQASRHSLSHVLEAPQGQTKAQVRCRLAVHVAPSLPLTLGAGTQRGSAFLSSLCAPQGASLPVDSAPAVCLPIFPRSRLCAWHPWWLHLQHILAQWSLSLSLSITTEQVFCIPFSSFSVLSGRQLHTGIFLVVSVIPAPVSACSSCHLCCVDPC